MTAHSRPIALEMLRLTALLTIVAVGITVGLPFVLALAATAGR